MTEITEENLWFQITDNTMIPKWYVNVLSTHEYEREVQEVREKYGELVIMEKGYDESNRYGWFCVFGVPIVNFLRVYPKEQNNFEFFRRKLIPKIANKYRGYATNEV
tara:strand:- start:424 stop:744 length:321 start_codon:yes stop_codon:yes gene_type:complete